MNQQITCIIDHLTNEDQARWVMAAANKAWATPGFWKFIYLKGLEGQDGIYIVCELNQEVPIGTKLDDARKI